MAVHLASSTALRRPARRTSSVFDVSMLAAHLGSSSLLLLFFSGALSARAAVRAETAILVAKSAAELYTRAFTPDLVVHHLVALVAAWAAHAYPRCAFLVVRVQVSTATRVGHSHNARRTGVRPPRAGDSHRPRAQILAQGLPATPRGSCGPMLCAPVRALPLSHQKHPYVRARRPHVRRTAAPELANPSAGFAGGGLWFSLATPFSPCTRSAPLSTSSPGAGSCWPPPPRCSRWTWPGHARCSRAGRRRRGCCWPKCSAAPSD